MAGTISTLGVGSGLDLQGILEKLREVDQAQILRMETRQLQYKDQLAELETVNSMLLSVKSSAFDLSLNTTFETNRVASSDETVLTATVDDTAAAGTLEMTVGSLAKQNVWQSDGVAAADTTIASAAGTFDYTVDGITQTVSVTADMTLRELADAINDDEDNPGVTASVMDDGTGGTTGFHLVITSDDTGTDNAITMDDVDNTNDTILTMGEQQVATNAQVTVNTLVYERQTNTIDDILTGVTLALQGVGDTTVTVNQDTAAVQEKIVGLVTAYNAVLQEIDANTGRDEETGVAGSLNGLSAVRTLEGTLNNIFFSNISGLSTEYRNLTELGFTFERTGSITVDEDDLAAALASNLDDAKALFLGDAAADIDGIADRLYDALVDITLASSDGIISSETARVQASIDQLDDQVERTTERLDARYDSLAKQFTQLDQLLSTFENTGNYLSGQFKGLSDMWAK